MKLRFLTGGCKYNDYQWIQQQCCVNWFPLKKKVEEGNDDDDCKSFVACIEKTSEQFQYTVWIVLLMHSYRHTVCNIVYKRK